MRRGNIIEHFAPYPRREQDVTAEALYRHGLVAATVQWLREVKPFTEPGGPSDHTQHMRAVESHLAQVSTLYALRALMGQAQGFPVLPDESAADHVARNLWSVYEAGDASTELLDEWLTEAGFDWDAIAAVLCEALAATRTERTVCDCGAFITPAPGVTIICSCGVDHPQPPTIQKGRTSDPS